MPLLLADTETLLVPRGQVIVAPGPVPQPPVHISVVTVQRFGSEKPSWPALSAAPPLEVASTVMLVRPPNTGSVCCTVAPASARPEPDTLSGWLVPFSDVALPTIS